MLLEALETPERANDRIIYGLNHNSWAAASKDLYDFGDQFAVAKYESLADLIGIDEVCRRTNLIAPNVSSVPTMIDYKLHDNPDTMQRRAYNIAALGASIITVHGSASEAGLKAAMKGVEQVLAEEQEERAIWLLGVTILTSFDNEACISIYGEGREPKVLDFAHLAAYCGLRGVVCAAHEAELIKNVPASSHLKVAVPGIRPSYMSEVHDQAMTATPKQAIESGADFLIPARAISRAADYGLTGREAVDIIAHEIEQAT